MIRRCEMCLRPLLMTVAMIAWAADRGSLVLAAPNDTVVQFDTSLGSFQVELFNAATPVTVENFLNYLSSGLYDGSFVHRSIPDFVVQGGGWYYRGNPPNVSPVPTFPPIINEHGLHNVRGTIAMATVPGNPNSATCQWFINLIDNSSLLDTQNGGYTVFGPVLGQGMNVVDAIVSLPRVNAGSPFDTLPVIGAINGPIQPSNLVLVNNIRIVPEPSTATLLVGAIAAFCGWPLRKRIIRVACHDERQLASERNPVASS
jgi:peptidyl-prolyl cis-trans isomerase A (cyclophilin A)